MRILRTTAATATIAAIAAVLALTGVTGPAHAAGHAAGYVWANQPATPFYVADTGYEYNSSGQPIEITRTGVGDYTVRFVGLSSSGGVAQVSPYGVTNSDTCTLLYYRPKGTDLLVRVRCFDGHGSPTDSRFIAHFTDQRAAPAYFAYLFAHDPDPAGGSYHPAKSYAYDSTGVPITVTRVQAGRYQVHLGSLDATFPRPYWDGFFRATAYSPDPVRCEVLDPWFVIPHEVPVRCYDPDGMAVDSAFTLTYANGVNVLGEPATHATVMAKPQPAGDPFVAGWSNPGGKPIATRIGVGDYLVAFPALGGPFGHAIAAAHGTPPQQCSIASWYQFGGAAHARVRCWDAGGAGIPTDVWAFNVAFTH
jgi:hypothetical protein